MIISEKNRRETSEYLFKDVDAAPNKKKTVLSHHTYEEMIKDAIVTLKERTGSSKYAIQKFIEEKKRKELPPKFRKLFLRNLKRLVASGELVKVRASFKLPTAKSSSPKAVVTSEPFKSKSVNLFKPDSPRKIREQEQGIDAPQKNMNLEQPKVMPEKERIAADRLPEELKQLYCRPGKYMVKCFELDEPGYQIPEIGQPGNRLDVIDITEDDLLGCGCEWETKRENWPAGIPRYI